MIENDDGSLKSIYIYIHVQTFSISSMLPSQDRMK